jgi:REP element-mobilizing transposase RayT
MLAESLAAFAWRCFAYCLMGNHYHLVVATPQPNISAGMHRLNGGYARWFNRVHGHQGHLFENRFHSELVERDSHLLEACRYVVLNPVRAALVAEPADWPWSSYRATVDMSGSDLVASTELLELFGLDGLKARRRFVEFVRAGPPSDGSRRRAQVPGTGTWR